MSRFHRGVMILCVLVPFFAGLDPGRCALGGEANGAFSLELAGAPLIYADASAGAPVDSSEETSRPLMGLLTQTSPGRAMQNARINVYGWIEGSYENNFNVRDHTPNVGRSFDVFETDKGYLNQLDLTFERKVNPANRAWDIGGRVDLMYGSDSRFTTSSGLFDHQGPTTSFGFGRQEAWLDVHQAYVDIAVPILDGFRLRVGKFEFFKAVDPNANALYTHPYEYLQAFPYTLTGLSAYAPITPTVSMEGGISRGWNQSLTDNNSAAIDGFARVTWNVSETSRASAAVITGPEQFHDSSHSTTAADITYLYAPTEQFALALDVTYAHQAGAVFGDFPGANIPAPQGASPHVIGGASWYGLTGTVAYRINDWVIFNSRAEWYRDEEGYSEGFPGQVNLYEVTIGVNLMPFHGTAVGDDFKLRPELRYDYASRNFFSINNPRHDQLTFAIDGIFNF